MQEMIEKILRQTIEEKVRAEAKRIVEAAKIELEDEIAKTIDSIALSICKQYEIFQCGDSITIKVSKRDIMQRTKSQDG